MAKIALNKSAMTRERNQLRLYQRVLPSLDLKRRQLTLELARAREQLEKDQAEVEKLAARSAEQLPMLADREVDVSGLVKMESAKVVEENVVGVKLPVLEEVKCTVSEYSMLAKPPWVDVLVDLLQRMAELRVRVEVAAKRVQRMDRALKRITQRVNLFEKILIPSAKKNIQTIQIFLGDADRAAVVRSKIAKLKHERQRQAMADRGVTP